MGDTFESNSETCVAVCEASTSPVCRPRSRRETAGGRHVSCRGRYIPVPPCAAPHRRRRRRGCGWRRGSPLHLGDLLLEERGGQEVRVPARVGNSRLLKPSRQASSVKCGARSSRKRRAAAGSGAAQRSRGSLDATRARGRAPPTTGSRVGRLGLGRPQPLVRHHTRSQLLAVYGAGVSRGGLEGARYERTTPQTVWEPGRPFQWFGLRAPLVRSTKWAFSWPPLSHCYSPAALPPTPRRAPRCEAQGDNRF